MKILLTLFVLLFSSSVVAEEYDYNFFVNILSSDLEISLNDNSIVEKKWGFFQPVENRNKFFYFYVNMIAPTSGHLYFFYIENNKPIFIHKGQYGFIDETFFKDRNNDGIKEFSTRIASDGTGSQTLHEEIFFYKKDQTGWYVFEKYRYRYVDYSFHGFPFIPVDLELHNKLMDMDDDWYNRTGGFDYNIKKVTDVTIPEGSFPSDKNFITNITETHTVEAFHEENLELLKEIAESLEKEFKNKAKCMKFICFIEYSYI